MTRRSYTILGTGALGGYYGALLARSGLDVRFLLRSDFEHVRDNGLVVDSVRGDFTLPRVSAYGDAAELPPSDVTLVCLKTTQNDALPTLLSRCVKDDGVVVVLQNGYAPERQVAQIVGDARVIGGLCFLCANKLGPGHIQHLDYGHIHLGEHTPDGSPTSITPRLQGIVEHFRGAGIDAEAVGDLRLARWKKLLWNVPYNGLSAVLNQTTDVLMREPASRRRVEALMREVRAAAEAVEGRLLDEAAMHRMLAYTQAMEPYKTSMMLDREAGRPMEVEAIVGEPLRAGLAAGAKLPEMTRLYEELRAGV